MSRITLIGRREPIIVHCEAGESISEAMTAHGIYHSADCGGRGTCGKCRLRLISGELKITSRDRKHFTDQELEQGFRLACQAYPLADCRLHLLTGDETDFEVIAEHSSMIENPSVKPENYAIAVDIGTTTIAVCLLGLESKKVVWTDTAINRQRAYGADVISRIAASNDGKKELLQESIRKDLSECIKRTITKAEIQKTQVKKIAIACNMTMGHLLLGYSCEGLGAYPFVPVNKGTIILSYQQLMGNDYLDIPVTLLPSVSVFVGGDVVAGLLYCGLERSTAPSLLLDLGTNGEMAVGSKEKLLAASAAAGPAFEGGNISCGIGSVAGAITDITIEQGKISIQTIGGKPAIGICGTGVIALCSELLKEHIIDSNGLLCEDYFETGYPVTEGEDGSTIVFTQKDIRELQMAKAAIRTGIEILLLRYGITYDDINTVYLAGGFGYKMNIEKANHIGLLPKEFTGKIKAVGNSALSGAIRYLTEGEATGRVEHLLGITEEISLSQEKEFNELYISNMSF